MGRAPCCDKANVKKGPWSPEEDAKLKEYIEKNGTGGNWIALPQKVGLRRCGKSCRLRWLNYLRPNIKHGDFSEEEDRIICNLYANIGSRWSIIAAQLPGRTDNDIKNYWNTKLKKKAMAMGMGMRMNMAASHQRNINSTTASSSSPSHLSSSSSPSSSLSYNFSNNTFYSTPATSFTGLESVPFSSSSGLLTGSSILYPQESFSSPMQFYQVKEGPFMVGGEPSCSSSDGSINNNTQISHGKELEHEYGNNGAASATEQMGFQGFTGLEENQKIWGDDPSDYGFEEIKQLISTNNMSCNNYLFDENKAEEGVMYY